MSEAAQTLIFGEVLYDCFPDGSEVLGGAPFNVAWHLHALGDQPRFISRVGTDEEGRGIVDKMTQWGMDTAMLQRDDTHPTGRVNVSLFNNEPSYTIVPDSAYDFIEPPAEAGAGMLYHGSLALRNKRSRSSLEALAAVPGMRIFMDVNLRAPWWHKDEVLECLDRAHWVKLNEEELQLLGTVEGDLQESLQAFQQRHELEIVVLTLGERGAMASTTDGRVHSIKPQVNHALVDTVGAGDAFSAVFIHGLLTGWDMMHTLEAAQAFASEVVGMRGATCNDVDFYRSFKAKYF